MGNSLAAAKAPFILAIGIDLKDTVASGFAFDQAGRIATRIAGSQVHVVYVLSGDTSAASTHEAAGLLRLYVSEKWAALGAASDQVFGVHVRRGEPARELAQFAAELSADMLVVGSHKVPQLKALFLGSTAEHVMAAASCPVFVAGPRPKPQPSHVIVIDPPCPDCLRARAGSEGRTWWCERHSENHHLSRHHGYSYMSELPFSTPDMSVSGS